MLWLDTDKLLRKQSLFHHWLLAPKLLNLGPNPQVQILAQLFFKFLPIPLSIFYLLNSFNSHFISHMQIIRTHSHKSITRIAKPDKVRIVSQTILTEYNLLYH